MALSPIGKLRSLLQRVRLAILVAFPSNRRLDGYVRRYAKTRLRSHHEFLYLTAARCLGILNYKSPVESGELPFLAGFLPRYDSDQWVAIDVGANSGQFASWVLASSRHVNLISYEPNPLACRKYLNNLSAADPADGGRRWKLVEKGVSSAEGRSVIYDYTTGQGSEHASLYREVIESVHHGTAVGIEINLCTLDADLKDLGKKICLLKFDVEGHELEAIKGASSTLARHKPPLILVEFNEMNAVSGSSFHAIRKEIGGDYLPHRLLPGGELLPLSGESSLMTEIYAYQNIAFIRRQ